MILARIKTKYKEPAYLLSFSLISVLLWFTVQRLRLVVYRIIAVLIQERLFAEESCKRPNNTAHSQEQGEHTQTYLHTLSHTQAKTTLSSSPHTIFTISYMFQII